jgi:hypothetical protein
MAKLNPDRTIEFESLSEFLGHYDSHISKGGFYLDSDTDWTLRELLDFTIVIVDEARRTEFQAEVVFSGGGKVGLQLAPDPANKKAVSHLVQALRSGTDEDGQPAARGPLATPQLKDDGTILYDSAADFMADYAANLASGGTYVESPRNWPTGSSFAFLIRIQGQDDFDMPVQARIMSAGGGLVGLQLELNEAARSGMADLVQVLRDFQQDDEEVEEAGQAHTPLATDPVSRGLAFATRDASEFGPFELFDIRPDVKPQTTLFGLVAAIVETRKALRLELVNNQITLSFRFKSDGSLVDYTGPNSEHDLLDRLVKAAFLDKAMAEELAGQLNPGQSLVELVTARKAVNRQQLMIALGEQAIDALEAVRAAGEVPFRVFEELDEWEEGCPFGALITPWLERAIKALPAEMVKELLKPIWKRAMLARKDARWPLADLAMDSEGRKLTRQLNGQTPINDLVTAFDKRNRDKLFRLAIALRCLGAVDLVKPAGADPKVKEAQASLLKEIEQIEKGDRFAQAGVHWSAHPGMYPQALQELQRKYGRTSNLARSSQEASKLCQRRIELAKHAHEFLADDFQRQEYRKEVIKANLLADSAQLLFRKAQAAISEDNPRGAVELLEMAIELDDKPEYRGKLQILMQHLKKDGT